MKKQCKVVMVPTNQNPSICHQGEFYHLYILSDDEINEGDWVYCGTNLRGDKDPSICKFIEQYHNLEGWYGISFEKIIATTDELFTGMKDIDNNLIETYLPRPPKEFLHRFCQESGIWDVMVEYESYPVSIRDYEHVGRRVKVALDNTISIYLIKQTFSREEVEQLLNSFADHHGIHWLDKRTQEWIKINL